MKQLISFILSFLLLLSSTGLTYAQHYCGGHKMMEKITFGEAHLHCGMAMISSDCDETFTMMDCCDNEYAAVDTDDHFAKAHFDVQLDPNFVVAFAATFVLNITFEEEGVVLSAPESSPPLRQSRPLYQVFETYLI